MFPTGDTGTRRRFVAKGHALVFTSNGQVHHHWTPADFRLRTRLNKLYERIFVVVETDNLPIEHRTALFTPDRSQLLANEAALQLEDQVADFLDNWHKLGELNSQLVREAISSASGGRSALDIGRRIATALKVKGFNLAGSGGSAAASRRATAGRGSARRSRPTPTRRPLRARTSSSSRTARCATSSTCSTPSTTSSTAGAAHSRSRPTIRTSSR